MPYDKGEKRDDPMAAGRAVFAKRVVVLLLMGLVLLWLAAACGRLGPYVDVPSLLGVGVLWLLGMALGVGLGNVCQAFGVLTWVEDQDVSLPRPSGTRAFGGMGGRLRGVQGRSCR